MSDIVFLEHEQVLLQGTIARTRLIQRVRVLESMLAIGGCVYPEVEAAVRSVQNAVRCKSLKRKQCALGRWRQWVTKIKRLRILSIAFKRWRSTIECDLLQRMMMRTRALIRTVQRRFRSRRATRNAITIQRAWRVACATSIHAIRRVLVALRNAARAREEVVRQLHAQLELAKRNKRHRYRKKQKISHDFE